MREQDVILKMPKSKNTFTGRCTVSMAQFETFKAGVDILTLKFVFHDKRVRHVKIQQWMIDSAINCGEYMLMFYSKNVYQKMRLRDKALNPKKKFMSDEDFYRKFRI